MEWMVVPVCHQAGTATNKPDRRMTAAERKRGFSGMKNRIIRCIAVLSILCVMLVAAAPMASAVSNAYGVTQDKIRVRETSSTNSTIIDNIVKNGLVYITSSHSTGDKEFVKIKYRNADGEISTGWACRHDVSNVYIKVLSQAQTIKAYGENIKGGTLPSKKVGTFTAAERKASEKAADSSYIKLNSSGDAVKTLQTKLQKLGYYTGSLSGNAGNLTIAAIKSFQSKNGLTADGVAGPATLAKIDAAYSALSSSSSSSSSSTSKGSGLRLNSSGTDVRDLQNDLTYLGYYWAKITGNFGTKTETAVKRFQEENGLKADGIAGTKTLNAIAAAVKAKGGSTGASTSGSVLKLNSQGDAVKKLQEDLTALGYYYATKSGNYGSKTEAAVKEFQKDNGLSADGVAGSKTLEAIAKKLNGSTGSAESTSSASGLRLGSTGIEVANLQENLTTLGFYYGDVTKHFGQLTQKAVKAFQKSRGLTQDGIAGKKTLEAIESAVAGTGVKPSGSTSGTSFRKGDSNNAKIGDMQSRLASLGYYYGQITNSFGDLTEKAVKKFQDANGLTVDGIAGPATLSKLYSLTGGSSSGESNTTTSGTSVSSTNSYGKIIKNNVYLRSKASTTSAAKASLKSGTLVRISKVYTTSDNVKWYYITVKQGSYTYNGYVRSDMLETITEEQYNAAGGNSANNESDREVLGMIIVTGNGVRLRYSPSTDADKVGEADKGDTFYYVDTVDGWFQTSSGYWISKSYARVMTSEEVDNVVGSGSTSTTSSTYRYGSTGSTVKQIQTMLADLGYYSGTKSGNFGYQTEDAVKAFQRANGLSADGVVGKKTMDKLTTAYNNKFTGGETKYDKVVYNLSWNTYKNVLNNLGLKRGNKTCKVTDLWTGKTFDIYVQSTGNHADVEPLTAADTAVMCSIYGVSNESQIGWERRPILVTIGAVQVVASMYGESHGQDDIAGNNYEGQFCIHFKDSTNHSTGNGTVPEGQNHQDRIAEAVKIMKNKGCEVRDTYATSQQ